MTLNFTSWILCPSGPTSIGYQYDNLTDVLQVTGTVPAGWSWDLMVQCGTNLNIIPMEQAEDGSLSVVLTAEMIPLTGYYTMQLRATQGELVKYTNQFQAYVGASLSGDAQWPTVPTEFTQVEQNILDLNQHPPYPGDAGYWMTWDLESGAYVQSQLPLPPVAEGPPGKAATIQVGTTTTGEPGTEATVQNVGNENAAILNFTIPAGAAGPTGTTPDISVRVSGLPAGSEPTVSVSGTPEAPVIYLGIPAGQQGTPGTPGTNGTDGTDGQTPNITIGTVETLPAGSNVTASITGQTPNLVLNLGIPQGPAGAGVPSTDGVPTDYLLSPAGWVAPPDTNDNLWGYHERVELEVQTGAVIFTPDKPLKKILLLIYAKQEYADEAGQDEPSGDCAQYIRINNSGKSIFYNLFFAGSFAKFKKSRVLLEIVESNLVGTYEKLVGSNSGGYDCYGADAPLADDFPIYDNINSVSIHPRYEYVSSYGNIGRFTAGSTFEIWGVYL